MTVTRRRFLQGSCAVLAAPLILRRASATAARIPLPRLSTLDARESHAFSLSAMRGESRFGGTTPSPTMGFNQSYLGPLVRVRTDTTVEATVTNQTNRAISSHWHGLLIEGAVDGGPHNAIPAGETWKPILRINQPAATLWYHSHIHGETAQQVYAGLAGVLIVDDDRDAERGLPRREGIDDLVLVLQDKRFDEAGGLLYKPSLADVLHGFLGDSILVNGAAHPTATVPAGLARLRLLNGSNGRNYDLSFADGRSFHLIATDQGLLPEAIELARLRLTPGERAEILVDFAGGGTGLVSLPHSETEGGGGMNHAMMAPLIDPFTEPFTVLTFDTDPELPVEVRTTPSSLGEAIFAPPQRVDERRFVLNDMGMMVGGMGGGPVGDGHAAVQFGINGRPFDMARIDFNATPGTAERWIVSGQMMGHPFHVHGTRMLVVSENGLAPRPENSGWKDTVFIEGEVEMILEFPHVATADHPFMLHCHILEHEDRGMMGQFAVTSST